MTTVGYIVAAAAFVIALVIGFPIGIQYRKKVAEKEISSAEDEAKRIINEAIKSAEGKKREALLEAKEEILKKQACFRAGTTAGSEGAEVARTRATLSFSSSALKGRGCFRDRVTGTTSDAEASTTNKKLAARSCTRSAGVEGAMARKMRRQAHPSFA